MNFFSLLGTFSCSYGKTEKDITRQMKRSGFKAKEGLERKTALNSESPL